MSKVWLSLGSNIQDKKEHLQFAVQALNAHPDVMILRKSSIYQTSPWGKVDQDVFLNAVVEIQTDLEPLALLDVCQAVENSAGRKRDEHWGPRTLDIDLLFYDNIEIKTERLTLPHPHMHERLFVLAPLSELVTDRYSAEKLRGMINKCHDQKAEVVVTAEAW